MSRLARSIASCVLFAVGGIAQAESDLTFSNSPLRTSIAPQSLASALQAWAHEAGVQVMYATELANGLQSPGSPAGLSASDALEHLLSTTGLEYRVLNDRTISVIRPGADAPPYSDTKRKGANASSPVQAMIRLAQAEQGSASSYGSKDEGTSAGGDGPERLEEIVVTAQRREESLQDVPISITALTGDRLDTSSLSVNQELARVPGVAVLDGLFGSSLMTIRGVAATNSAFAGASTTGYYLDTVPFGFVRRAFTPNANAFDLERVEVLRGPQGTLYGVSSQSGVVRVLTHAAELDQFDLKFRTNVSTTVDGGTNSRADVAVNIPVIQDRLGVRVVYGREDLSGWIDRPSAGERDINDADITNGRIRIDATPTDRLTLSAMYWHNEESYGDASQSAGDRTTDVGRRSPLDSSYDIYSFTASYDFGPFVFTSATSHIDYVIDGFTPLGGDIAITQHFPSEVFAQELSLASTGQGPWRWSIGAIYRDAEDTLAQNIVCGSTPCLLPNPEGLIDVDQSKSHAVFGELTRSLTEELDLTVGLRYFEDEVTYNQLSDGFDPNAVLINRTDSFDSTTPRVVLTWRPTDDFTTYASYAQGFRSGFGQNGTALSVDPTLPAAGPDTLTSYEVGAKGDLWSDSVSYEVAAYYQEWEGVQQLITVPFLTTGISAVINGPSASGPGVDLSFTWRPLRDLSLTATYSWNDLTFDADVVSGNPPVVVSRSGDRLTDSPELTAGFSGEYQWALGGGYEANLSGGVSQTSSRVARGIVSGNLVEVESDEVTTVNARFAVDSPSGWTISLFGENLNDFDGTPTPTLFSGPSMRLRPMTVGLQFEYQLKRRRSH